MPSTADLLNFFQVYYETWGYPLILLGAITENIFPIGYFVPGSTLIWLGAFYSYQGNLSLTRVIFFGTIGSFLGHNVDYFIGRTGWYLLFKRVVSQERLEGVKKYILGHRYIEALIVYFIGYTRSFLIIGMGIFKMDYPRFVLFAIISAFLWNFTFGIIGYSIGSKRVFLERGLNIFWLIGFFLLVSYLAGKLINQKRRNNL